MADSPQLSQSTSIAKATTTDDRLNQILPSMATEYSPVRVYLPGSTNELPSAQQDGRQLPDGTERYVWVAPDVNGDGSDYTVQVECIGAGGGGGGGTNEVGFGVVVLGTWTGTTGTTATITPTGNTTDGDTLVMVIQCGNTIAQTTSVTDTSGNQWTLAALAQESSTNSTSVWAYVCYGAKAVTSSSTVTFTTTNSEVVSMVLMHIPEVLGPSSLAPQVTSQATAGSTLAMNGSWNANEAVLVIAANNNTVNWNGSLDKPSGTDSNGVNVAPYWVNRVSNQTNNSEKMSVFFGNPTQAASSPSGNIQLSATASMVGCVGIVIPFQYAHLPVPGAPGGGGGGGEYAAENAYPVTPGRAYAYYIGNQGTGGHSYQSGDAGGNTIFDLHGFGIQGGVVAHGGSGGQQGGNPGAGGTGSTNSIHFDGGAGGASSAGVGSDDPVMYHPTISTDAHYFRLTFDESIDNNAAYDAGQNKRTTVRHLQPGGVVRSTNPTDTFWSPPSSPSAPIQVPPSKKSGTTTGNVKRWAVNGNGQNGGYEVTGIPTHRVSVLTISAWIHGAPEATSSTDWGGSQAVILGCSDFSGYDGFSMYMANGKLCMYVGYAPIGATGSYPTLTATSTASVSATDGNWHLVQADFHGSSSGDTLRLWIDGVLDSTWTTTSANAVVSTVINADFNMSVGFNLASYWNPFKGSMSNVWFTSAYFLDTTTVAQIYGSALSTGGGGGGASGGSAGAGNPGGNSSGTSGGTPGAANTSILPPGTLDSNIGSPGGASGQPGLGNGGFGAGGGGAGHGVIGSGSGTSFSLTAPADRSATYTGMDASSSGGTLFSNSDSQWTAGDSIPSQVVSTSLCITGGKPELPSNGTMASILQFPVIGNLSAWDGTPLGAQGGGGNRWAIDSMYLTLTVKTPNAALIGISSVRDEIMPDELTDTELAQWIADGTITGPALYYVQAGDSGRQVTLALNASLMNSGLLSSDNPFLLAISTFRGSLASSAVKDLGIGGYSDPENQEFYCEFYGAGTDEGTQDAVLSFDYHFSNNNSNLFPTFGGSGRAGQIRITYLTSEGNPVTSILPVAATDVQGNQLAAGITTSNIRTWKPGSSPKILESWTNVSPPGSWTGTLRYKMMENNSVRIQCNISGSSSIVNFTLFTLPISYRPLIEVGFSVGVFTTTTGQSPSVRGYVETDGTVTINGLSSNNPVNQVQFTQDIPLD